MPEPIDWRDRMDPSLSPLRRQLPFWTFGPLTTRLFRLLESLAPHPPLGDGVQHTVVDTTSPLHLYRPTDPAPKAGALLYLHGGGMIMGHPKHHARHYRRLVETFGITVAAATYRLAPEHRFPAAIDDVHAAWTWLIEHADELGIDPARIVVMGDSAGGGLAACLAQRLHDEGGAVPVGQALVYPMLDHRTALDPAKTAARHLVWNNGSNLYGWSSYLGDLEATPPPYAVAALREDLTGLPATWMTVGTLDLFWDEDQVYADRLEAAGVAVERHLIEGAYHGVFTVGMDEPPLVAMWESLEGFLRRCWGAGPG